MPLHADLQWGKAGAAAMRHRFIQHRPALVHLATPGPLSWAAMRVARSLGIPITTDYQLDVHANGPRAALGWLSPIALRALRYFHNHAARTHVPTVDLRQQLELKGFRRLKVVGRGVDSRRFQPQQRSPALRQRILPLGAPPDSPILLYAGRLSETQNVGLALDAFEAVRAGMPGAAMAVVGDGPQRKALQAKHPLVHFAGTQTGEDLACYYASADFFLFPSLTDAYGLQVLEALASGLPVLAFDTGAAVELLPGRGGGRLIPPGEDDHYITAACALAWQHRHAALMRAQARQIALSHPWAPVLDAFETSLMEVAFVAMSSADRQTLIA
jgi:glycosyltransferase involved in cell wall biosynthesis